MRSRRWVLLAALTALCVTSSFAQAGVRIGFGISLPLVFNPCPRPVYVAPAPVYVMPAPAPYVVQPAPVVYQVAPVPAPAAAPAVAVPAR
jgi:hypothetical protein